MLVDQLDQATAVGVLGPTTNEILAVLGAADFIALSAIVDRRHARTGCCAHLFFVPRECNVSDYRRGSAVGQYNMLRIWGLITRKIWCNDLSVMDRFAKVIDLWPTAGHMAGDIGVAKFTTQAWKKRGIPSCYWIEIVAAAERRGYVGVTLDRLAFLSARHGKRTPPRRGGAPQDGDLIGYVVGFAFAFDRGAVVLVRKARPAWQSGLYNGVGGHIDAGETPGAAMARECREESGLIIGDWQEFCQLSGPGARVHFFRTFTDRVNGAKTMTDEPVMLASPNSLPPQVLPCLRWLIPLALNDGIVTPVKVYDNLIQGEGV